MNAVSTTSCTLSFLAVALIAAPAGAAPSPGESLITAPAGAALTPGDAFADLLSAWNRGDAVARQRAADDLGIDGMKRALASRNPHLRRAAAAAAPLIDQPWHLLWGLVDQVAGRDGRIARAAASTIRRIAEQLRPATLERHEELTPGFAPISARLYAVARRRSVGAATAANAVLALAALTEIAPIAVDKRVALIADRRPEVRRAAIELLAANPLDHADRLARLVHADKVIAIARAAAAALCADVPPIKRRRASAAPKAASAILAALQRPGLPEKLRATVADAAAPIDEQIDIAACLSLIGGRENLAAVRSIRRRARQLRRSRRSANKSKSKSR